MNLYMFICNLIHQLFLKIINNILGFNTILSNCLLNVTCSHSDTPPSFTDNEYLLFLKDLKLYIENPENADLTYSTGE